MPDDPAETQRPYDPRTDHLTVWCHLNEADEPCFSILLHAPAEAAEPDSWGTGFRMVGLGEDLDGLTKAQTRAALVGFGWAEADANRAMVEAEAECAHKWREHLQENASRHQEQDDGDKL